MAYIYIAIGCAISAFTYREFLIDDGELLDFIPTLFKKIIPERYKIHKIFWKCNRCIAGQLSLWSGLIISWDFYDAWMHLFSIMLSIFLTAIINKIWNL